MNCAVFRSRQGLRVKCFLLSNFETQRLGDWNEKKVFKAAGNSEHRMSRLFRLCSLFWVFWLYRLYRLYRLFQLYKLYGPYQQYYLYWVGQSQIFSGQIQFLVRRLFLTFSLPRTKLFVERRLFVEVNQEQTRARLQSKRKNVATMYLVSFALAMYYCILYLLHQQCTIASCTLVLIVLLYRCIVKFRSNLNVKINFKETVKKCYFNFSVLCN